MDGWARATFARKYTDITWTRGPGSNGEDILVLCADGATRRAAPKPWRTVYGSVARMRPACHRRTVHRNTPQAFFPPPRSARSVERGEDRGLKKNKINPLRRQARPLLARCAISATFPPRNLRETSVGYERCGRCYVKTRAHRCHSSMPHWERILSVH